VGFRTKILYFERSHLKNIIKSDPLNVFTNLLIEDDSKCFVL